MILQGTWEEVSAFADKLSGRKVRVTVLSDAEAQQAWAEIEEDEDTEPTLSPEQWQKEREALRTQLSRTWPAGVSAVDAVAEQRR